MQDIWDRYKDSTFVNFVASGSVYTLMNQIYMDAREPLYGRCDSIIKLRPFSTSVLKDILHDHKPDYTNEDLLALYTFTGGVPKYIDLFMQKGCTDMESMVDYIVQSDSPFLNEGKALLIQEFGKKYGNYFAILADIANGRNTTAEIEQNMGDMVIAGHLKKLEEDYELIVRKRPILAKEGSQTVRFEISDSSCASGSVISSSITGLSRWRISNSWDSSLRMTILPIPDLHWSSICVSK